MTVDTRDILDPLRETLRTIGTQPRRTNRLATVTSLAGGISVRFDEESTASPRKYKCISGGGPTFVGERVLMTRAGSTYVIVGGLWDFPVANYVAHALSSSASIGHGGFVTLNLAEQLDPMGFYNPANGVYTIPKTGLWEMTGSLYFGVRLNPANHLLMTVHINGAEWGRWSAPGNVAATGQGTGGAFNAYLGAGTTVYFTCYQDGGGTITVNTPTHQVKMIR